MDKIYNNIIDYLKPFNLLNVSAECTPGYCSNNGACETSPSGPICRYGILFLISSSCYRISSKMCNNKMAFRFRNFH